MASVYKRTVQGKKSKKWTIWYLGADGKGHTQVGCESREETLRIARKLEADAKLIKAGVIDPQEQKRHEAALKGIRDHVEDYRLDLIAKGNTAKHCDEARTVLIRLFNDASIGSVADLAIDRLQAAIGRLNVKRSARTANKATGFVRAFATWLYSANRIKEVPRGFGTMARYNEEAARKLERRAISLDDIAKLLSATELGPLWHVCQGKRGTSRPKASLTGPQRAALYRLTLGTGFRASEIATLTPERFDLDSSPPTVTVRACYAKNGKEAVQPIAPELAELLRPFVEAAAPGQPVFPMALFKTAKMLAADLKLAGIEVADSEKRVVDFHALRHAYITHLVGTGLGLKSIQSLARHSTITLTMDRYAHAQESDARAALDRLSVACRASAGERKPA